MIKRIFRVTNRLVPQSPILSNYNKNLAQFATLYQLTKRYLLNERVYKTSNIKFQNQGVKMLAYLFNPQVMQDSSMEFNKRQHILNGKMTVLSFLSEVGDGMEEDAWNNRKAVSFNLKECFQLFKVADLREQKIVIEQDNVSEYQQKTENYSFYMEVAYSRQKGEVTLWIAHYCERDEKKTHLWDVNFVLRYNEYRVLCEWIRSGIYYSSGTALMIEHSKQHQILMHSLQKSTTYQKGTTSNTTYKKKK